MSGFTRHRERPVVNEVEDWAYEGFASTTFGTCDDDPGPTTRRISSYCGSGEHVAEYSYEAMDDVVTPDFKKLSGMGKIINNPMSKSSLIITRQPVNFHWQYQLDLYGCSPARFYRYCNYYSSGTKSIAQMLGTGDEFLDPPSYSEEVTALENKCVSRAHSNIGSDHMLALATAAEIDETIVGLAYLFRKVYRVLRSIRRADLRMLRGELSPSELSEIYLAARYTLRPVYYDVKGIINVLTDDSSPGRRTFRASDGMSDWDSDTKEAYLLNGTYAQFKLAFARTAHVNVAVRAGVLTHAQKASLSDLLGLGQLVETAWDLTPFSFIVDWFLNVGDTICAWTPKTGFHILSSWVTVDTTITQTTTVEGCEVTYADQVGSYYNRTPPSMTYSGGSSTKISKTFTRTPNPERPIFPSLDVNLDPWKILDLALIVTGMTRERSYLYN